MTRLARAITALKLGLAHRDDGTPLAYRYGQLLGSAECALEHLKRVDPDDVATWISEECCANCGSPDVAVEFATDTGTVVFCARHGEEHQRQLDWIAAVAELPEAKATLRGE